MFEDGVCFCFISLLLGDVFIFYHIVKYGVLTVDERLVSLFIVRVVVARILWNRGEQCCFSDREIFG